MGEVVLGDEAGCYRETAVTERLPAVPSDAGEEDKKRCREEEFGKSKVGRELLGCLYLPSLWQHAKLSTVPVHARGDQLQCSGSALELCRFSLSALTSASISAKAACAHPE
jgi:hypothetical protein